MGEATRAIFLPRIGAKVFVLVVLLFQLILTMSLTHFRFTVATGELLTIFIPLVWTSVGTSGLSIIYLFRRKKEQKRIGRDADAEISRRVVWLCAFVLGSTIFFISLSLLYPARRFLRAACQSCDVSLFKSLYDSLLVTSFGIPCFVAAIIGGWILVLEMEKNA